MVSRNIKSHPKQRSNVQFSNQGFSLIELLIAMLILTLIIFAFTPLLVRSIQTIVYAGDKTEALYEGQSELEVKIAERETAEGKILEFVFDGHPDVTISVPGDAIYELTEKGDAEAWISGFVPYLPILRFIEPPLIVEGYIDLTVKVEGHHTNFNNANNANNVNIYKNSDLNNTSSVTSVILSNIFSDPLHNRETAEFTLPNNLTVSNNPYIFSVSWLIAENVPITVDYQFYIYRSDMLAVGEGQRIWISPGYDYPWIERIYSKGGTGDLTGVVSLGQNTYAAVSRAGRTIVWSVDQDPQVSEARSDLNLNAISYGNSVYVAVGDNGKIVTADSESALLAASLSTVPIDSSSNLHAITYGDNKFVAVGDNGTIISINANDANDANDLSGNHESLSDNVTFKGVTFNGLEFYIVGVDNSGKAVIYRSKNDGWESINLDSILIDSNLDVKLFDLNDIIFDGGKYVAVGSNGTILTSDDGSVWVSESSGTTSDLYSVDWGIIGDETNTDYIAVGQNGVIVARVDNSLWTPWTPQSISQNIYGVVLRK